MKDFLALCTCILTWFIALFNQGTSWHTSAFLQKTNRTYRIPVTAIKWSGLELTWVNRYLCDVMVLVLVSLQIFQHVWQ